MKNKKDFFYKLEKNYGISRIQFLMLLILVLWAAAVFALFISAIIVNPYSLITWSSLSAFFTGFSSVVLIVIAVFLLNKK